MTDKRADVLGAVTYALKQTLADRPEGEDLDGQLWDAVNPPTIKQSVGPDGDSVTLRAFTAQHEYRVTIEAVRP